MGNTFFKTCVNRREALKLGASLAAVCAPLCSSAQQTSQRREFLIDEANIRPRPIAVPNFLGGDPKLGGDLAEIVCADLERSGLFRPLDPAAFIDRPTLNTMPRYADWRAIGAEALVVGAGGHLPDGRIRAQFRLWDVVLAKEVDSKQFDGSPALLRRLAHRIADQVYQKMTLETGYFDTRVVFVDETGSKEKRLKRLAIMDQDGFNVRLLSQGREIVLTPRFSPSNQEIAFMTYVGNQPRVVLMRLESGQRETLGDFPGMTFAPRFAPDGQRVVMSSQQAGASSIVEMDLRSRRVRQLTQSQAIDTGPCYAPNGQQIVFESDREGYQQLYVMNADGSGARRISRGEGRYATPVWSPRGDYIAFTKQVAGRFLIGVMRPDGEGERVLTEGFHNEGPTWAPNGRVLMFFREQPGANGGPRIYSIDLTGYNERQVATPSFASDPAWSPLLS